MRKPVHTTIRSLRLLRGLSCRELARRVECAEGTIRRIGNGGTGASWDLVLRLLDELEADAATRSSLVSSSGV